jgi:hypothetical protein
VKPIVLASAALAIFAVILPVSAADDAGLTRMALCQDSWVDWSKSDPARLKVFAEHIRAAFSPHANDPYMLPKANVSVAGLRVVEAFPDSVGMGVGFSLTVDAPFDATREVMEKALGKTLQKCETSDGMRSCELEIAEQRTFTLMAGDDPKSRQTLIGCYYYYEK